MRGSRLCAAAAVRIGVAKVYRLVPQPLAAVREQLGAGERPTFVSARALRAGGLDLAALAASGEPLVIARRLLPTMMGLPAPEAPLLGPGLGGDADADAEPAGGALVPESHAFALRAAFEGVEDRCGVIEAPELPSANGLGTGPAERELRLLSAAREQDVAAIEAALAAGADPGCNDAVHGATPLHLAVASVPAVQALAAGGADVDARASNGSTPLHWAAGLGLADSVEALLALGADPSVQSYTWGRQVFGKDSGQTALHWAAGSGHLDVVELLADADASALGAADERGQTAREVAISSLQRGTEDALAAMEEEEYVCVRVEYDGSVSGVL